jgi:hypothetical protein
MLKYPEQSRACHSKRRFVYLFDCLQRHSAFLMCIYDKFGRINRLTVSMNHSQILAQTTLVQANCSKMASSMHAARAALVVGTVLFIASMPVQPATADAIPKPLARRILQNTTGGFWWAACCLQLIMLFKALVVDVQVIDLC